MQTDEAQAAQSDQGWNAWAEQHVSRGIQNYFETVLRDAIGLTLADERERQRSETEEVLLPLRQELSELRGRLDTLMALLGGAKGDVVNLFGRKSNAG